MGCCLACERRWGERKTALAIRLVRLGEWGDKVSEVYYSTTRGWQQPSKQKNPEAHAPS